MQAQATALTCAGRFRPYKPVLPMTVTIRMKTVAAAQAAALRPGVERLADHTVQGRIDRQCDVVVKWILGTRLNMPEARGTRRARSVSAARRCDARTGLRPSQGAA